jgi:hypothetical protein
MSKPEAYAILANCRTFYYARDIIMEAWRVANAR